MRFGRSGCKFGEVQKGERPHRKHNKKEERGNCGKRGNMTNKGKKKRRKNTKAMLYYTTKTTHGSIPEQQCARHVMHNRALEMTPDRRAQKQTPGSKIQHETSQYKNINTLNICKSAKLITRLHLFRNGNPSISLKVST